MIEPERTNLSDAETPNNFVVEQNEAGKRLDAFLADRIHGWSRSRLQKLIENEDVLVNEKAAKPSHKLREKDENISLDIAFEDEYLAVINKSAGMVVHPGAGVQSGTLANAIAFHFAESFAEQNRQDPDSLRIGIVHRLDKDTSGLIVVAKTDEIHEALSQQFRDRVVYKSYIALVHGSPDQNMGKIDAPIGRNKHNRLRMKVATYGRSAISLWKVRKRYNKFTLLDVEIKTGRTHQIRVHMGYINHPVVGDEIYNEGRDNTVADTRIRNAIASFGRFFLHAEKLSFTHPKTGERLEFTQELAPELKEFLDLL